MIRLMPYAATGSELRRFAGILATVFALIAGWIFWRTGAAAVWAMVVIAALLVPAALAPGLLAPVYRVWMNLGHALGWLNTRLILGVMFFGVITPLGLFRRAIGKNALQLRPAADQESYASPCKARSSDHFNWQF